jgi:hypothetical protein
LNADECYQFLKPFLPEKDNYFARKERQALVSEMQMKVERGNNRPEMPITSASSSSLNANPGPQQATLVPSQHRFPEELDPTDIGYTRVEGDEVLRLLVKLNVVSPENAAEHGPHNLCLGGLRVQEMPPVELSGDSELLSDDRLSIGTMISERDFAGCRIVWPGRRLPPDRPSLSTHFETFLDWRYVYFLEKLGVLK